MTMGLILLGIFTLSLFFDFGRAAFKGLGLSTWAAFLVILAFAIGIIVPAIPFTRAASASVGGFILPIIAAVALLVVLARHNSVMRGIAAMLAVVAITFGLLLVMPMGSKGMRILTAFTIGLISGAISFIIARSRAATTFALTSGIAVGNLIYCLVDYFALDGTAFMLGSAVVYNSIFIAVMFALCLAVAAVKASRGSGERHTGRRSLNVEAAQDEQFDVEDREYDHFDDDLF